MENKELTMKVDKMKDPEVVLVQPEHEEGAVGGEIQPEGTVSSSEFQQPTISQNGADQKRDGKEKKGDGQPPPATPIESPSSPSKIEALGLHQPDDDTDVGWQTADDQSDDEVPPQMQEKTPMNEPNEIIEAIKKLQLQLQNKPNYRARIEGPPELRVRLYDHQEYALAWMLWRESCEPAGGILADDMGFGKTVTTIALIIKSLENESLQKTEDCRKNAGGTLIVCPANLTLQWRQEIETKGNIAKVIVQLRQNETSESMLTECQVVITSYEVLSLNYQSKDKVFFKINWKRVVLDEAHIIKNSGTRKSKCVAQLVAENKWALTGIPFYKKVNEIFPILRFLKLKPFDDLSVFKEWIATDDAAARLQRVLDCVMLKRTKDTLLHPPQLPLKTIRLIDVDLRSEDKYIYNRVMIYSRIIFTKFVDQMKEGEKQMALGDAYKKNNITIKLSPAKEEFFKSQGAVPLRHIVALIMRLRQICCHPALMKNSLEIEDFKGTGVDIPEADVLRQTDVEILKGLTGLCNPEDGEEEMIFHPHGLGLNHPMFDENIISPKIIVILGLVQEIMEKGEKVVIFSDWVNYLNIIGQHLGQIPGVNYGFSTGAMSLDERAHVIGQFNGSEEMKILLVSLKAIGQRLDLKTASNVIFADIHWNPEKEAQAVQSVHRIGQTKNVFIHKLICQHTIDERIVALQRKKMRLVVLAGGEHDLGKLSLGDISSLLRM